MVDDTKERAEVFKDMKEKVEQAADPAEFAVDEFSEAVDEAAEAADEINEAVDEATEAFEEIAEPYEEIAEAAAAEGPELMEAIEVVEEPVIDEAADIVAAEAEEAIEPAVEAGIEEIVGPEVEVEAEDIVEPVAETETAEEDVFASTEDASEGVEDWLKEEPIELAFEAPAEALAVEIPDEEAVVEEPAVERLASEEPKAEEPAIEEPTSEEPVVEEPAIEEPVAEEPAIEEPVAEEPVAAEPAAEATAGETAAAGAAAAAAEAAKEKTAPKGKKGKKSKKKKKNKSKKADVSAKDGAVAAAATGKAAQKKKMGLLRRLHCNKKGKFSILKVIRNLFVLGLGCFLVGCIYAYSIILTADPIDPTRIYDSIAQNSIVYDDEGREIDEVFYTQNRSIISYEDMSPDLINAFVAIEDKTFWTHHGFNWIRMFGAIIEKLTGHGNISGTSTITQQLARNVYLPETKSERSIRRKLIEMYYAYRIERTLTKEQIMEAYLNSVYFGFGAYGVDAAAESYFSKSAKDLTLEECAALAALPQLPDTYALVKYVGDGNVSEGDTNIIMREPETYVANDSSADRRNLCLDLMLEQGYITKEQHDAAYGKSVMDFINPHIKTGGSNYTYFTDYLLDQVTNDLMERYNMTYEDASRMVYTGGLRIYSTLDTTAQDVIVKEFNDDDNYPYLSGIRYDYDDNIIASDGSVMLYDFNDFFNEDRDFVFGEGEAVVNSDGSVTVKRGNKLNIYTTEVAGNVDYSVEFKNTYVMENYTLYIYQGGYINIPAAYKSLDENDDLVISADYFTDYPDHIVIDGGAVKIKPNAYSLPQKVIQPQSACAIVQVGTGQVKALVGGRGATGRQLYNRALNPRQPGSSIKPLSVYGAALQRSYEYAAEGKKFPYVDYHHDKQKTKYYGDYLTAASIIIDEKMTFDGKTWPYNVDNTFRGGVTMREGMRNSLNTVAVKIELQLGNEYCANMLQKFGLTTIETEDPAWNDYSPGALALGGLTHGVIPLEMAQAYATYPNGGIRRTSIAYTEVKDRNGNVILTGESEEIRVVDEGVAWIMTDMLKYVVSSGYAYAARLDGVQSGGKSGTTNSNYDIWFDGITPNYACVVWIGTDVNIPLSTMSIMSVRMWGRIMNQIPKAKIGEYRSMPGNIVRKNGEYFTKGTETGLSSWDKDRKTPDQVMELIEKASLDDPKSIEAARKAYNKLDKDERKDVKNYHKLEELERQVEEKEKKEKRDEAYKKWVKEREKHRKWIEEKGHYEETTVPHDAVYETVTDAPAQAAWDEETDEDDPERPIIDPETGEITGYEKKVIHHDAVPAQTHQEMVKPAWDEPVKTWVVDKPGYWEYEVGWRDGDFKYEDED